MKYSKRSVRSFAAAVIAIGALTGGANAATITFDDAWSALGDAADPSSYYDSQGVTFSGTYFGLVDGVGNGDSGNWKLQGTVGSAFLGTNQETAGNPTITFSEASIGSIDIGISYGDTSTFQITGFAGGSNVFTETVNITDDNNGEGTWQTFTFSDAVDTVTVRYTGGTAGGYGIDNLNFTAVPEPSAALLLGLGILGAVAHRRRTM